MSSLYGSVFCVMYSVQGGKVSCVVYMHQPRREDPPRSYTSDEALDELFILLSETNITNDENGDLDELDFTVEVN